MTRPDRENTRLVGTHVDDQLAELYQLVARLRGTTGSKLIGQFISDYLGAHPAEKQLAEQVIAARKEQASAPAQAGLTQVQPEGVLSAAPAPSRGASK